MSKLYLVLFLAVVLAVCAVDIDATPKTLKAAAKVVKAHKVSGGKHASGLKHHITAMITTVLKEAKHGKHKYSVLSKRCSHAEKGHKKALSELSSSVRKLNTKIRHDRAAHKHISTMVIPGIARSIKRLSQHKDVIMKTIEAGDLKRKAVHKGFVAKMADFNGHLAFVRKLYLILTSSTVDRRRTVFLQAQARIMHKRSLHMSGKASELMEMSADAMSTGHLDAINKLLDQLRSEIQKDINHAKRREIRSEKRWIKQHASLRKRLIKAHRAMIRESLHSSREEVRGEKFDQTVEGWQRKVDTNMLKKDHHERDLEISKLGCIRMHRFYRHRFVEWRQERAALIAVLKKLGGFYKFAKKANAKTPNSLKKKAKVSATKAAMTRSTMPKKTVR